MKLGQRVSVTEEGAGGTVLWADKQSEEERERAGTKVIREAQCSVCVQIAQPGDSVLLI